MHNAWMCYCGLPLVEFLSASRHLFLVGFLSASSHLFLVGFLHVLERPRSGAPKCFDPKWSKREFRPK